MSAPLDARGIVAACCFIVIGALAIYHSSEFSPLGSVFPRTIAAAMILLSGVYVIVALLRRAPPVNQPGGSAVRRALLAVTLLAWAFLLEPLGFLSTSVVCYTATLVIANYDRWTPRRMVTYAAVGFVVLGGLYAAFRFVLQVPFPTGLLL